MVGTLMNCRYIECVLVSIRFDIKVFRYVIKRQYILDSYVARIENVYLSVQSGKKELFIFRVT